MENTTTTTEHGDIAVCRQNLEMLVEYSSPPAAAEFKPVTHQEILDMLAGEYAGGIDPSWPKSARENYLLDQETLMLARDMAADGVRIMLARDEDGLYLAAVCRPWRCYCGPEARWIGVGLGYEGQQFVSILARANTWIQRGSWGDPHRTHAIRAFLEPYTGLTEDGPETDSGDRHEFTVTIPAVSHPCTDGTHNHTWGDMVRTANGGGSLLRWTCAKCGGRWSASTWTNDRPEYSEWFERGNL